MIETILTFIAVYAFITALLIKWEKGHWIVIE